MNAIIFLAPIPTFDQVLAEETWRLLLETSERVMVNDLLDELCISRFDLLGDKNV